MIKKYIDIGNRLKILRGKLTQSEFASDIGTALRAYQYYEAGDRVPPIELLTKISKKHNKSVDWILTGIEDIEKYRVQEALARDVIIEELIDRLEHSVSREERLICEYVKGRGAAEGTDVYVAEGKKFIDQLKKSLDGSLDYEEALREYSGHQTIPVQPDFPADDFVFIRQVNGKISAGGGLMPDNSADIQAAFRKDWIKKRGGKADNMSLIKVAGDSMDPTLLSGDLVLVDHGRSSISSQGGIYAVSIDDEIMIKRVQPVFPDKILVLSDNKQYPPFEIARAAIVINGKVIWYARELER
jgi:phage repressor protein C with HTH and peptisase S24 domain/DNA-binding XRE family transcriptional regulator